MKNILKYSMLFVLTVLGLASCTEDYEYSAATAEGQQVYFQSSLASTVEISPSANSFNIPVNRIVTDEAVVVPLTVTAPEGSIFSIPSSVAFEAGQSVANITVSYDPAAIVYGNYEDISITIGDEAYTTQYGFSSYNFKAGVTAWVKMAGTATYREDLVASLYSIGTYEYAVNIEKNVIEEGLYRLVEPYGAGTPFSGVFDAAGTYDWGTKTMEIDATDPDFVWVKPFDSGVIINSDEGEMSFLSYVSYDLLKGNTMEAIKANAPDNFGKMKDGVITMPAKSMLASIGVDGYYYANSNGLFRVALPGVVIKDYSAEFQYTGRLTDVAGDDWAQGIITFGEDVEAVKYVVATSSDDLSAIANGIVNGSVEAEEITATGEVSFKLEESGTYYVVMVAYAGGEPVGMYANDFKFKSSKDGAETFTDLYTGIYTYNVAPMTEGAMSLYEGTDESVLSVSDSDDSRYRIYPWANSSNGLIFTWADDGTISIDAVETGDVAGNYGMFYFSDCNTLTGQDLFASGYDNTTGTFHFAGVYHNIDGMNLGIVEETFLLTGQAAKEMAKVKKIMSSKRKIEMNSDVKPTYSLTLCKNTKVFAVAK